MELKALDKGYNSVYILLPLGSIFNFNFNRKYSSLNCHSKSRHFAQHHRERLKPNLRCVSQVQHYEGADISC